MQTLRAAATWDVVPLGLFPLLAEVTLKAAAVVLAALLASWLLRGRSAAVRHTVWASAMVLLVLLPGVVLLVPDWRVLPVPDAPGAPGVRMTIVRDAGPPLGDFRLSAPYPIAQGGAAGAGIPRRDLRVAPRWTLTEGLAGVWAAGLLLIVLRYAAATVGVRRWTRGAHPLGGTEWANALACARATLGHVPTPRLIELPAVDVPLVWGVRQPVVFLPPSARAWTDERRSLVLTHELAHVRRGDVLLEALVQLCCALYWFHPGVWLAARRLRLEREQACDDLVVAGGVRPSTYAVHLLAIAEGVTPRNPPPIVALCAARLEDLDARMATLLSATSVRNVPTAALRAAVGLGTVAALAALGPLAPRQPVLRAGRVPPRASMVFTQDERGRTLRFVGSDVDARRIIDSLRAARGRSPHAIDPR